MMGASPLGRYAPLAAVVAAIAILLTALLPRVVAPFTGQPAVTDAFVDNLAFLAVGVLFGQQVGLQVGRQEAVTVAAAKINGLEGQVAAAHRRLDAAAVPPAPEPETSHGG